MHSERMACFWWGFKNNFHIAFGEKSQKKCRLLCPSNIKETKLLPSYILQKV